MKTTFKAFIVVASIIASVAVGIAQTRAKFEVVSIRPSGPQPAGTRGGGPGGGAGPAPAGRGATTQCPYRGTVIDPSRITAPRISAFRLIAWAYEPEACGGAPDRISGAPEWTTTDRYDLQATFPAGTPLYGFEQLQLGEAPKLQEMLQTMLADRFKLKFHLEKKEVASFDLVVAKPGKITPSKDLAPPPDPFNAGPGTRGALTGVMVSNGVPRAGMMLNDGKFWMGTSIPMSSIEARFRFATGRPVADKTGFTGFLDFKVPMAPDPIQGVPQLNVQGGGLTANDVQLLDGLGLKLEPSKATIEILVIDSIEKPSEN